MSRRARIAVEAAVSAVLGFVMSLIILGQYLSELDVGWGGGDLVSTYVNAVDWGGYRYAPTTHFGFPLGMVLNYFPGIDITQNLFASTVNTVTGGTFTGINLLIVLSFPLVAALAYLTVRMTGLQGPLAIALAVTYTFIPFHWGRALGHTYLATMYSAVVGLALVLLVGSGSFQRFVRSGTRTRRIGFWVVVALMVVIVAWSGVYYAAFTLLLGVAVLFWRIGRGARWRELALEALPFAAVAILVVVGFLPSVLTIRADPPLATLGDRLAYESVLFAGNLTMSVLPLPLSQLPGLDVYNRVVTGAMAPAPYGESTTIANYGTWITSLCLIVFLVALLLRGRREAIRPARPRASTHVTLGLVAYLSVVAFALFVPWGVNYLIAGAVTAQIRGWNRLVPFILLLFILGAAVALARLKSPHRLVIAVPVAVAVLSIVAVDSIKPFATMYADSIAAGRNLTQGATEYAQRTNAALPSDCGVLQVPYVQYPENGVINNLNDYDHFWAALLNPQKSWSYGAVKYTDASVWMSQLPEVPTPEQAALLRGAGFCAIDVDTRAWISEDLAPVLDMMNARFGAPVATVFAGAWQMYSLGDGPSATAPEVTAFLHQPFISVDPAQVAPRQTAGNDAWWWTLTPDAVFTLLPTDPAHPVLSVSGMLQAPECGSVPIEVSLEGDGQRASTTILTTPKQSTAFSLALDTPLSGPGRLVISVPGRGCPSVGSSTPASGEEHFAKVLNLQTYAPTMSR